MSTQTNTGPHRRRVTRRILIVLIVALVAIGIAFVLIFPRDPVYGGRPLSQWVLELDGSGSTNEAMAKEAIRQMGGRALPFLQRRFDATDSPLKEALADWLEDKPDRATNYVRADQRRLQAAQGIAALGPAAKPALPRLLEALGDEEKALGAATAVFGMGADAVPGLTNLLAHPDPRVRSMAVEVLGAIGENGADVIPMLVGLMMNGTDPYLRADAARALGGFGDEARSTMPALVSLLEEDVVSHGAAYALGRIGGDEAWLAVIRTLSSTNQEARTGAAAALILEQRERDGMAPMTSFDDYARLHLLFGMNAVQAKLCESRGIVHPRMEAALKRHAASTNAELARMAAEALNEIELRQKQRKADLPPGRLGQPRPLRSQPNPQSEAPPQ